MVYQPRYRNMHDIYWSGGAKPAHGMIFFLREGGSVWEVLSSVLVGCVTLSAEAPIPRNR